MKYSQSLVSIAKKVVSNLAEMGLDGAGQFICGSRWPFFKQVLSPVIEELAERFPDLFINKAAAGKVRDEIDHSAELHALLAEQYRKYFAELREGQQDIVAFLLRQSEVLTQLSEASARGARQLNEIGIDVKEALALLRQAEAEQPVPPEQVALEVDSLQRDAMEWIEKNRPFSAQRRLDEARRLIRGAVEKNPQDVRLLALRGYVEKSQGQLDILKGEVEKAREALDTAANYFNAAHKADPEDPSALNGLANIYFYVEDYDAAVRFSHMALAKAPHYTEAAWDLAIALEKKLEAGTEPAAKTVQALIPCYEILLKLIPTAPGFTATQLEYARNRLSQLRAWSASAGKKAGARPATEEAAAREEPEVREPARGKLWSNGACLQVAFVGGSPELHEKVRTIASEWSRHANLTFTFGAAADEAQIRVSFEPYQGSWSYVGRDALNTAVSQATMNIDPTQDETGFRAAVLINFGRAMGLESEDRNPNAKIDWDKEAIIKELTGAPHFWPRGRVEHMLRKWPPDAFPFEKEYDPHSIMHAAVRSEWTRNGFALKQPTELSEGDRQWVARLYPRQ